tara:strand:- start:158 stop:547 length:390 start_codon:yes stop_codon:yes gene_type:complete
MPMPPIKFPELGKRLKRCRLLNDLIRKEVATFVAVDQHTVYYWENGRTRPNAQKLIELAKLYNVSVDYLVGNSEDPQRVDNDMVTELQGEPTIVAMLSKWKKLSPTEQSMIRTAVEMARNSENIRKRNK